MRLTNAQAAANARAPYAAAILKLNDEIQLLRALASSLGATGTMPARAPTTAC